MLLARSWNPIRKGLVTERTWVALTAPAARHYVGLAPQSSTTENARYSMADPTDDSLRSTINTITSGICSMRTSRCNICTFLIRSLQGLEQPANLNRNLTLFRQVLVSK